MDFRKGNFIFASLYFEVEHSPVAFIPKAKPVDEKN
jgi:hypothetical protein